jgi:hypothetical protein
MASDYSFHSKFAYPQSYFHLQEYATILDKKDYTNRLGFLNLNIPIYIKYLESVSINKDYNIIYHILYLKLNNPGGADLEKFKFDILIQYIYKYFNLITTIMESINIAEIDTTNNKLYMTIKYKIIYVIYKTIIILYSYCYYLNIINNIPHNYLIYIFQDNINAMDKFFSYLVSVVIPGKNISSIEQHKYDYDNPATKTTFLSHVINSFHIYILNNPSQYIISKNHIIESYSKIAHIIQSILQKQTISGGAQYIFEDIIYILINKLYDYEVTTSILAKHIKNLYITLPQYNENCWLISMLTCMCFSDLSKDLLLSKINQIIASGKSIPYNDKILFDTIHNIIINITLKHKVYSETIQSDCEFLQTFKNDFNYMSYIYHKYNEFITANSANSINIDSTILSKNIGSEIYHYYLMAVAYNNQILNLDGLNRGSIILRPIGLQAFGLSIITTMYKIFDVSILFIHNFQNKMFFLQNSNDFENPEIIFIQLYNMDSYLSAMLGNTHLFTRIDIYDKIDIIGDNTITYNGNTYKLDYIINKTEDYSTCTNCGHIISGIHYKKKEYYHDSDTIMTFLDCSGQQIRIPCSLIEHEWSRETTTTERYCIKSCFHNYENIEDQQIDSEKIIENALCFNNQNDILFAYVKQPNQSLREPKKPLRERIPRDSITSSRLIPPSKLKSKLKRQF